MNSHRIKIFLYVFFLIPVYAKCQWNLQWSNLVPSAYTTSTFNDPHCSFDEDGNAFVLGPKSFDSLLLSKFDVDGTFLWTKDMLGRAVGLSTYGSEVRVTGLDTNLFVVCYDKFGTFLWRTDFSAWSGYSYMPLVQTTDGAGNLFIAGCGYTTGMSPDIIVTKVTSAGDVEWFTSFNNQPMLSGNQEPEECVLDEAGNLYVCGFAKDAVGPGAKFFTTKIAPNGNLEWFRSESALGSNSYFEAPVARCLTVQDQGGIVVAGNILKSDSSLQGILVGYDELGNIQFSLNLDSLFGQTCFPSLLQSHNNAIYLVAKAGGHHQRIARFSANGTLDWSILQSSSVSNLIIHNEHLFIAGRSNIPIDNFYNAHVYIMEMDLNGNFIIEFAQHFSATAHEGCSDLDLYGSGDFLLTGKTSYNDLLLVKLSFVTGIGSLISSSGNFLYPNPTAGQLFFSVSGLEKALVQVRNSVGQVVLETAVDAHSVVSVIDLPAGFYTLLLYSRSLPSGRNKHLYSSNFIKQ